MLLPCVLVTLLEARHANTPMAIQFGIPSDAGFFSQALAVRLAQVPANPAVIVWTCFFILQYTALTTSTKHSPHSSVPVESVKGECCNCLS